MACWHEVLEWIDSGPMNCSFIASVWFQTKQVTEGSRRYQALIGMFSLKIRAGTALLLCFTII
jgi:hypothetical protein